MNAEPSAPESAEEIQIRLKPLFGVAPKHYLAVIYGAIILAGLFALLVLPGLTSPGTVVTVTSVPSGAAVTWHGRHWGTTPLTVFLPQGEGDLTVSKPGFQSSTKPFSSGGQLFLSLLIPRTDAVSTTLSAVSSDAVVDLYRAQIGKWALAIPFTSKYQFPPLFTRLASDAAAAGLSEDQIRTVLLSLRESVADPQMYADYGKALHLWTEAPPEGLEEQYNLWKPLAGETSGRLAFWLLANQTKPLRDRQTAEPSDWLLARVQEFKDSLKTNAAPTVGSAMRTSQGTFRNISAGSYLWGTDGAKFSLPVEPPFTLPVPVTTPSFWIADAEVTQAQFAAFVAARPEWAPAARDTLIASGKADADYLAGWTDKPPVPSDPVTGVSWYAAQAYAAWATTSLGGARKAALPDDFEWEAAARAQGGTLPNQNDWEWTSSAWYPGQPLVWSAASDTADSYARSLKGGNAAAKGKAWDRAGWPASGATSGLGFRLVLVSP
jgi:formylglycine-generating enzyme required for sulfatase activity